MDTITYKTSEADAIACKSDLMLSKTSSANYVECRPVLATHRRLLCMNVKQPNVLRVLNRHGKFCDTTIKASKIVHLVSTEKMTSHPALFYAVGGKDLVVVDPSTQANGDISVKAVEYELDEELLASTAGEAQRLWVLSQRNVIEVEEATGVVKSKIPLVAKTVVKYPTLDYHQAEQLLLVPAKSAHLNLISARTRKSALSSVWEPHEDATPTFACFFQHHSFADESGKEVLLVTAAHGNREIRFWAFDSSTQKFSLRQQLNIACTDSKEEEFDISITANEDYITLCSRTRPYAVVVETHRSTFKAYRVTTWRTAGPALCSTTCVGKVTESAQSKSSSYELFLTVRTAEGFSQSIPDANKLAGASNLTAAKTDSVANWFSSPENNAGPGGAMGKVPLTAPITAVSSSLTGESKTSGMPEAAVANIIRTQSTKFCDQVKMVDADLLVMQKNAADTMRMLQESRYREEAQESGRSFAARNRARLVKSGGGSPAGATAGGDAEFGVMTESERELLLSIKNFVQEVKGSTSAAASSALHTLLARQLKISVERASAELGKLSVDGAGQADITGTAKGNEFRLRLDREMDRIHSAVKDCTAVSQSIYAISNQSAAASCAKAHAFRASLVNAVSTLKLDLEEAKRTVEEVQRANVMGGTGAAGQDPSAVLERALGEAKKGNWAAAATDVLGANDVATLIAFLEDPVCQENQTVLASPKTLTLPLFLSLCLQLTFEIAAQPGLMPLRLLYLSIFYVEWDDTLRGVRTAAATDNSQASVYEVVKRELASVVETLDSIPSDQIDRKSRNKERLVRRLVTRLLTNEDDAH